jgi:hypothetical protein
MVVCDRSWTSYQLYRAVFTMIESLFRLDCLFFCCKFTIVPCFVAGPSLAAWKS